MRPKDVPVLLADVDGVISLFGFDHTYPPPGFPVVVDGMPHWKLETIDTTLGATLLVTTDPADGITDGDVALLEAGGAN